MTVDTAAPTRRSATVGTESPTLRTRLEPVRRALIADAKNQADEIIAEATAEGEDAVAAAEAQRDQAVAQARHRAELSAKAYRDQVLARAGTDARRAVLAVQHEIMQQLVDQVHTAISAIRDDPRYPRLLDHLTTAARAQLGEQAEVQRDPTTGGGVIARSDSRQVDYRLDALADRALETIADQVADLWT